MLGEILQKEREKQNLTIKDIERDTSIRALYIESIEKADYDVLPGEVYLKGFIKTYANYLNLDGTEMLKKYYEEKNASLPQEEIPVTETVKPQILKPPASTKIEAASTKNDFKERVEKSRKTQQVLIGVVLAGLVVGGLYWGFSSDDSPEKTVTKAPTATVAVPKVKEKAVTSEKKYEGVELTAKFNGKCWTKVIADDKTIYEGTPKDGESLSWKADKEMVMTVGNAGAVQVTYNGKSLGEIGKTGDVLTKKFTNQKEETVE
jgi:transcriptional regulator with XRE-family HTH domain